MLADLGCRYVEVGHSERRRDHGETPGADRGQGARRPALGDEPDPVRRASTRRRRSRTSLRSSCADLEPLPRRRHAGATSGGSWSPTSRPGRSASGRWRRRRSRSGPSSGGSPTWLVRRADGRPPPDPLRWQRGRGRGGAGCSPSRASTGCSSVAMRSIPERSRGSPGRGDRGGRTGAMRIAVGADHLGLPLKDSVKRHLEDAGHEVVDFGVHETTPVDYPDVAVVVARAVADGTFERAILVCGTGIGMAITANKVPGRPGGQRRRPVLGRARPQVERRPGPLPRRRGSSPRRSRRSSSTTGSASEFQGGDSARKVAKIDALDAAKASRRGKDGVMMSGDPPGRQGRDRHRARRAASAGPSRIASPTRAPGSSSTTSPGAADADGGRRAHHGGGRRGDRGRGPTSRKHGRRRAPRGGDDRTAIGRIDILVNNAGIMVAKAVARDDRGRVGPDDRRQPEGRLPVLEGGRPDHDRASRAGRSSTCRRTPASTTRRRCASPSTSSRRRA